MAEQTKYYDNLILDNPISQVIDDSSNVLKIERIKNEIFTRNIKLQNIGSHSLIENADLNTEKDYIPYFTTPIFFNKKPIYQKSYFAKSQRWICNVIDIGEKHFTAKLEDLNQPDTYEIGEFEIDDISSEDKELFRIGAVFYWSIGLAIHKGQAIKQSLLRFQRVNNWTEKDYDISADEASDLLKNLNWEE